MARTRNPSLPARSKTNMESILSAINANQSAYQSEHLHVEGNAKNPYFVTTIQRRSQKPLPYYSLWVALTFFVLASSCLER
ncbi:hypothetical protein NMYAN_150032 [Nitrosomonas nitrosa]|uniref:Uncharacterized protein n=1 Tax=Nitrosomonas nitrosa TaxID=52442 RepID=A0A8H9D8U5_9PROT|nr:hypothetical protein NMYAN_150032 [Nitrosomonas nitrosa]